MSSQGLRSEKILCLAWTRAGLAAGTPEGIYLRKKDSWIDLDRTLKTKTVRGLSYSDKRLWAASDNGARQIHLPLSDIAPDHIQDLHYTAQTLHFIGRLIKDEPAVEDVQKAVIRYSNTRNGKTRNWQIASRLKALLPSVSFSLGRARGNNIDLDRGGTNDADVYIVGPEEWDKDTDIGLSWDLGDILFSPSQTSIDVREKLMVELRDELVTEATRLYFERRRLQIDMLFEDLDTKKRIDAWLRIEELTAQIDGLTGGYFTKNIKHGLYTIEMIITKHDTLSTAKY
jgi:hypothetical protein